MSSGVTQLKNRNSVMLENLCGMSRCFDQLSWKVFVAENFSNDGL